MHAHLLEIGKRETAQNLPGLKHQNMPFQFPSGRSGLALSATCVSIGESIPAFDENIGGVYV